MANVYWCVYESDETHAGKLVTWQILIGFLATISKSILSVAEANREYKSHHPVHVFRVLLFLLFSWTVLIYISLLLTAAAKLT